MASVVVRLNKTQSGHRCNAVASVAMPGLLQQRQTNSKQQTRKRPPFPQRAAESLSCFSTGATEMKQSNGRMATAESLNCFSTGVTEMKQSNGRMATAQPARADTVVVPLHGQDAVNRAAFDLFVD